MKLCERSRVQWDRVVQGGQLNILKAWSLKSQIENYQSSKNNLIPRLVVGLEKEICRGSWRRRRRLRLWTSLCTRQGSRCQCPGGNRIDMNSQYQISTYVKKYDFAGIPCQLCPAPHLKRSEQSQCCSRWLCNPRQGFCQLLCCPCLFMMFFFCNSLVSCQVIDTTYQ